MDQAREEQWRSGLAEINCGPVGSQQNKSFWLQQTRALGWELGSVSPALSGLESGGDWCGQKTDRRILKPKTLTRSSQREAFPEVLSRY
ncbi:hypothetical protein AAC387_Pa12g2106 [Persea americana]